MRGFHKLGYRPPRTGERRRVRQPLRIDRLPEKVREAILKARAEGKTWQETAEVASTLADKRISASMCHRWYDLRVAQPNKEARADLIQNALDMLARTRPEIFLRLSASLSAVQGASADAQESAWP